MSSAFGRLPRDPHWRVKLQTVQNLADYGEEGDEHFLQIHTVPLSSMRLRTGVPIPNGDGKKKQVHLRMLGPPAHYPEVPNGVEAIVKDGYKRHIARAVSNHNREGQTSRTVIPFPKWKRLFDNVTSKIDNMIYAHHGIKCHMDGNMNNDMLINVLYLHVCDVLNIIACRNTNDALPDVVIRTNMLQSIPDTILETLSATSSNFTKESYDFMVQEIDFFYMVYAYYGNGSFLSLRTMVPANSTVFRDSSFFMNDDYFRNHQEGKLEELNRTETTVTDNYMFKKV
jgi:hypothetical protein